MTGERQFARRREDAQLRAVRLVRRRKHEHGFGQVELARDRLHRGGVEPVRLEHDRERIAGEALVGEHVERDEAAAHEWLLRCFSAANTRLGLTNSSCASISRISREPASAVRLSTPNTEDAARDSASAADPRAQIMREEQRRDGVARAVDRDRQLRRAHAEAAGRIGGDQIDRIVRRLVGVQRGHQDRPSARARARASIAASASRARRAGRGRTDRSSSNWFGVTMSAAGTACSRMNSGNAGPHEHAAPDIADHRIAAIARARVRGLHLRRPHRGSRRRSRPSPYSPTARRRMRRARRAPRCRCTSSRDQAPPRTRGRVQAP